MLDSRTSVLTPETNSHLPSDPGPYTDTCIPPPDVVFRHSGWQHRRRQVARCLATIEGTAARLDRFGRCGTGAWVWRSKTEDDHYRITADHCHDRWCLPCGRSRGRTIAHNLQLYLGDKQLRMITLTLRHRDESLRDSLNRLYKSFGRLRRVKDWQAAVVGGVAICEVKHGLDGHTWHPHLHIIVEGKYLPQPDLKAHWLRITEDSYIVDIRPVRSTEHLLNYVTKYVSKPLDSSVYATDETLIEAMRSMHGRRTCLTFGSWRGLDLTAHEDETEWESVGPLTDLLELARHGDPDAQHAILNLRLETARCPTEQTARDPPAREHLITSHSEFLDNLTARTAASH